jgi:uncharacterized protein
MSKSPKNSRRCICCRQTADRSTLLRIVRTHPDRRVEIDRGESLLQGRSAYICPTADCLLQAQKKNRLSRALKTAVTAEFLAGIPTLTRDIRK